MAQDVKNERRRSLPSPLRGASKYAFALGSDRGLRDCEGPQQTKHTAKIDKCLDLVLLLYVRCGMYVCVYVCMYVYVCMCALLRVGCVVGGLVRVLPMF